jgi:hypothetical protein
MNLFISIPLVLLAILAALFFLAKVKTENLGAFFKWSGYLVLIAAVGLLMCLMLKGARKMKHRMSGADKECMYMEKGMNGGKGKMGACTGMGDCTGMNKMNCGHGKGMGMKECAGMDMMDCGHGKGMDMKGCAGMDKMDCGHGKGMGEGSCCACCNDMGMMGKGHMDGGCDHMKSESTTDTIDGKIIKKEIKIIKK